jgi:hypothetical protein
MTKTPKYCDSIKGALLSNGKIRFIFLDHLDQVIETIICDVGLVKNLKKTLTQAIKDHKQQENKQ